MLKRYRYRAYLTGEQAQAAARTFGCVRTVFNDFIAERKKLYSENNHKNVSFLETQKKVTTLAKKTPERSWLADVSSVPLQQAARDAQQAFKNFFDSLTGKRKGGKAQPPKFKSRSDAVQKARFSKASGFSIRQTAHGVGFVRLPKIGDVRFALSRELPADPSSVTLIREADGRYYVSFVVDVPNPQSKETKTAVGIDVGLIDLATIVRSDGQRTKVSNPRFLKRKIRKLIRAQRALSRKKKGSKNREKARISLATQHRKVRESRKDFLHKIALPLAGENQAVSLETLNIKGMVKNRRLAKSIADASWYQLRACVEQACEKLGTEFFAIDRWAPTSQVCSVCGVQDAPKGLRVREWECPACGAFLDRDFNAALNILLAAGHAESLNADGGDIRLRLAGAVLDEAVTPAQTGLRPA